NVDYDLDVRRPVDGVDLVRDPAAPVPVIPGLERQAGVALRLSYGDSRGYTYTIGPQEGFDAALSMRLDHEALGSEIEALTLNYRLGTYLHVPLTQPATLALRVAGGLRARPGAGAGFTLGGVPSQDVVRALIDDLRVGATGYLRGYPDRS